jgi:hypothetical protein
MRELNLSLSLPRQLEMERQRRAAARMNRDQLVERCDELIQSWHHQQQMISELQKAAGHLQVELALKGAPPLSGPKADHYEMACDMAQEALAMNEGRPDGPLQQWARQLLGR